MANDNAGLIPNDSILNHFDVVFKREPFKDRGRYDLSGANRAKIVPTMINLRMVPVRWWNKHRINPVDFGERRPADSYDHEVFFAGITTNPERAKVLEQMRDFDGFYGGLHRKNEGDYVPEGLEFSPLSTKEFYRTVHLSRINLALAGYGQFTYRHLEIWALAGFMLSDSGINEVELPMPATKGVHYESFEDPDELPELVEYYLTHEDERQAIARNGRKLYERYYDYDRHGVFIKQNLKPWLG